MWLSLPCRKQARRGSLAKVVLVVQCASDAHRFALSFTRKRQQLVSGLGRGLATPCSRAGVTLDCPSRAAVSAATPASAAFRRITSVNDTVGCTICHVKADDRAASTRGLEGARHASARSGSPSGERGH